MFRTSFISLAAISQVHASAVRVARLAWSLEAQAQKITLGTELSFRTTLMSLRFIESPSKRCDCFL